jgi:hypothetical protein
MNFFKIKTTWTNAELIPLKLAVATAYILVGGYWHSFFHRYYIAVLIVFGVTVAWSFYLWLNKMKGGT